MKYYAVVRGRQPGVYNSWHITESMIKGFPGAIYKSFKSEYEASEFLRNSTSTTSHQTPLTSAQSDKTIIYTDGSYKDNTSGFGVVIITSDGDKYISYGHIPSNIEATNNVAELYAIYVALSLVQGDVILYTDSSYAIACFTSYIHDWLKNGWQNVCNRDIIYSTYNHMIGRQVSFQHVTGHKGIIYNEECDKLAEQGRLGEENLIVFKNGERVHI